MNWRHKALILWLLSIPAFTGFPINRFSGELLPGVGLGWTAYGVIVYATIRALLGKKAFRFALAAALVITLPVVLLGSGISFTGLIISGWHRAQSVEYAAHYLRLGITMLTVIPLALAMLAVIPIHRLEQRLLIRPDGVSTAGKIALMFLRVFNHILHFVIPNILEVIREEGVLSGRGLSAGGRTNRLTLGRRMGYLLKMGIYVGVEAICASVRYVPLWAEEISSLPKVSTATHESNRTNSIDKEESSSK